MAPNLPGAGPAVLEVLRSFRRKPAYRYRREHAVVADFAAFSGLSVEHVAVRIAGHRTANAADWNAMPGPAGARAARFYEASQNYVFDTLSANLNAPAVEAKLNRFSPNILKTIRSSGPRFLEFGAGIGVLCEIAARLGKIVTYGDVAGVHFDFAAWRFRRLGLDVRMLALPPDRIEIPGRYDLIFTDAVIEHLPPHLQIAATERLAQALEPHGALIFIVDLSGPSADEPMHYRVDICELHDRLARAGLACDEGHRSFYSIWFRGDVQCSSHS